MQLGEFFYTISTKGVEAFNAATASAQKAMTGLEKTGQAVSSGITKAFNAAGGAMRFATATIAGFATAGIAASVEGQRLAFSMSLLSRQVGSLFIPVIEAAVKVASSLTDALSKLTGAQQTMLGATVGLAGGITMVVSGLGTIPGILLTVVSAATLVGNAFNSISEELKPVKDMWGTIFEKLKGPVIALAGVLREAFGGMMKFIVEQSAKIAPLVGDLYVESINLIREAVGVVISAAASLKPVFEFLYDGLKLVLQTIKTIIKETKDAIATMSILTTGRSAGLIADKPWLNEQKDTKRRELTPTGGGFENVTAAFNRIQQAVANTFNPEAAAKRAEALASRQVDKLDEIKRAIQSRPAGAGV